MKFTLYVQRKRGRKIKDTRGIAVASLNCDGVGSKAYAWGSDNSLVVDELVVHSISICADGILVTGVEGVDRMYYQEWWLKPQE